MSVLDPLQIEKLEVLAGSRKPGEKRKAAIRIEDLQQLADYSYKLKSGEVSGAPTMAQHNALAADVRHIHQTLQSLSSVLRQRLGLS